MGETPLGNAVRKWVANPTAEVNNERSNVMEDKIYKRTLRIDRGVIDNLNEYKARLQKTYDGFGVYEEVTPNGWLVHQSYAICNDKVVIISESYNNNDLDDMLDIIDNRNESGKFGIRVLPRGTFNGKSIYIIHPAGSYI